MMTSLRSIILVFAAAALTLTVEAQNKAANFGKVACQSGKVTFSGPIKTLMEKTCAQQPKIPPGKAAADLTREEVLALVDEQVSATMKCIMTKLGVANAKGALTAKAADIFATLFNADKQVAAKSLMTQCIKTRGKGVGEATKTWRKFAMCTSVIIELGCKSKAEVEQIVGQLGPMGYRKK